MPGIIRLIVNPVSGKRSRAAFLRRLCDGLRHDGFSVERFDTAASGDATQFAMIGGGKDHALIVCGGDGTVREAACGIVGTDTPLIVAPTGTENLLAKRYGFRMDADAIRRTVATRRIKAIDVAYANDRMFLVVAGFGFDAEVVHRLAAARRGHISHATYIEPLWRTFFGHAFPRMRVRADGRTIFDDCGMVFIGNIPRYAVNLPVLRDAVEDDGRLDVCTMRCAGRPALIAHALRVLFGRHIGSRGVVYQKAAQISVSADRPVLLELDGDPAHVVPMGGRFNVEFRVVPGRAECLRA